MDRGDRYSQSSSTQAQKEKRYNIQREVYKKSKN